MPQQGIHLRPLQAAARYQHQHPDMCLQLPCTLPDAPSISFSPAPLQGQSLSVTTTIPQSLTPSTLPPAAL